MSCGVGCIHISDLMLLWLLPRLAAAAPIQSLTWKLPCASGVSVESKRKKRNKDSHCTKKKKLHPDRHLEVNNVTLNNQMITEEVKEEIKNFLETNNNEDTKIKIIGTIKNSSAKVYSNTILS